jgi:hypothetical protein
MTVRARGGTGRWRNHVVARRRLLKTDDLDVLVADKTKLSIASSAQAENRDARFVRGVVVITDAAFCSPQCGPAPAATNAINPVWRPTRILTWTER